MPRPDTLSAVLEEETAQTAQTIRQRRAARLPIAVPGPEKPAGLLRQKRFQALLGLVFAIAAAVGGWRLTRTSAAPSHGTASVQRGDIAKTISATGKLQAVTTVQVGTQVSGSVSELHADFNSRVRKGEIIARLDPSQFQAQLTQANANYAAVQASVQTAQMSVMSADASVEAAQANVERMNSVYADAQLTLTHTENMVSAGVSARRELDPAKAAVAQAAAQRQQALAQLNQAKAQAQAARSQLNQARAQAQQAAASVQLASVNVDRTVIRAPIDGVVVARNVDVGQTVAASLQAPTIFLIANDLTRMQVLADVDEADVGQLGQDSRVVFTVDAYPSDVFNGRISQIRLAPQTVQNVVTYTAVIDVDNPDLKLKPGMTANVTAIVAERKNVLAVPIAALRFRPESETRQQNTVRAASVAPTVWKVDGEGLSPVRVQPGLTDGVRTEIVSGDLKDGDRIAVPAAPAGNAGAARAQSSSPFRMGGGGRIRGR